MAAKQTKPILDTKTKKEYTSMYSAGKDLGKKICPEYTGADRLVWFAMVRKFPGRFQTKNPAGQWVALDDPSVPVIKRVRKTETDAEKEQRLLAELGEIRARSATTTAAKPAAGNGKGTAAAATAAVAEDEAVEGEAEEEVEADESVATPTPGPAKGKLAANMRKAS